MTLSGISALVTGASTGIGRATAKALSEAGARVGLAARTVEKLEALADEIEADGGEALVLPTDVRDRDQVAAAVEATREAFGRLDVMVNNAGVGHWEPEGVADGDLDDWEQDIDVNLYGVMYGTHLAARVMREQGGGDVVNVGSEAGRTAFPQWPAYVASKFGVRGFTESARRDLRDDGIRVTLIEPGMVDTPMQPDEFVESRPTLDPGDVADAVVYAVSRPDHVRVDHLKIGHSGR